MTISKQKFNGILKGIKTTGARLDALIADGIQYCVQQAAQGNFDAFAKLTEACPVYARRIVKDCEAASRATHKKQAWTDGADEKARDTAAEQLAERRTKATNQRKQSSKGPSEPKGSNAQAPQAPTPVAPQTVQGEPDDKASTGVGVTRSYTLSAQGGKTPAENVALSKSEYEHLMTKLAEYRTAKPAQTSKAKPAQAVNKKAANA